ncbi:hypothetical protein [Streptomyces sp. 7N604]|uniref:hypothetical protein n=1 Tax=Streptomyces sp. 7N604 TaxID=3457415 RepID=UPI003FD54EDF
MGYIQYGDGDNELNTYLRDHDMGRAGSLENLPGMIQHVRVLAPMWWEHTGAAVGSIRLKGGFMGSARSALIDSEPLFTACATFGLDALHQRLAQDSKRRAAFGEDHADRLVFGFDFGDYRFTEEPATDPCRFIDGTTRQVDAGTTVAMLFIDRVPVWSHPDHFGGRGYYDHQTRVSTVGYIDQAEAMTKGWHAALDAS